MISLSGIPIKDKTLLKVKDDLLELKKVGYTPKLVTIQVGDDYGSMRYVNKKIATCSELGIDSEHIQLDYDITESALLDILKGLNYRRDISAILVQLPLPKHIDEHLVACAIDPTKDADCFNPYNVGRLYLEPNPAIKPCTPSGAIEILQSITDISGKHVAVVGRSNIVGKPMVELLQKENASVTLLHSKSSPKLMTDILKSADIIVSAIGKAEYFKASMLGENQILIDIGINFKDGKQVGDFDYNDVSSVAYACTPPVGGTGACTIAKLMENVIALSKSHVANLNI